MVFVIFACYFVVKMFVDDAFSTRTGLERAGITGLELELSLTLYVGLLCKNKKQKGSARARPLPLRCLSQFFPAGENINCLGNEVLVHKSAYLSPMGWSGIYNRCFFPIGW